MDELGRYAQGPPTMAQMQMTVRERLVEQIGMLEASVKDLKEALEILDKNPEISRLLTLLRRVGV